MLISVLVQATGVGSINTKGQLGTLQMMPELLWNARIVTVRHTNGGFSHMRANLIATAQIIMSFLDTDTAEDHPLHWHWTIL